MYSRTKTRSRSKIKVSAQEKAEFEAMMGTLGTIGAVPALIGLWSVCSIVGGFFVSGGPLSLVRGFFSAIGL